MRFAILTTMTAAVLTTAGTAQQTTAEGTTARQTTIQQDFEAATALDEKRDRIGALAAWERLERRTVNNRRSHAIVQVRKSATLLALDRKDEAVAAARAGLAALPASDKTLQEDRFSAYFTIGRVAQNAIDYAGAATAYAQAEAATDGPAFKLGAILGQAETLTFVDPAGAAKALDRLDALVATAPVDKTIQADIARRRGLLFLNNGAFEPARQQATLAVKLLGGMTEKTDIRDVSARSDAAIASLLVGKPDDARRYMAMTGAGRVAKGDFFPGAQMVVPDCGGEAGLKPADMAVVEFSIGDDGAVIQAAPIYAVGGGEAALEFARAARTWSWTSEQVKEMPAFFRYHARVEMRCSTAFQRPSISDMLRGDLSAWLESKGQPRLDAETSGAAAVVSAQRAALAAIEAGGRPAGLAALQAMDTLIENPVVGQEERHGLAVRALAIAAANGAPAAARLGLDLTARETAEADGWNTGDHRRVLSHMIADPGYAGDAKARSALRLVLADYEEPKRARALLDSVAADPGLDKQNALRMGALIRIASLAQTAGDTADARMAFEKSGLTADQCALVDSPPTLLRAGGNFPQEAQAWGFEGWTSTQFDIAADGKVLNERAVLSYPPFVFTKAGVETVSSARFTKSYRPAGGLGCGGTSRRIRFSMPG